MGTIGDKIITRLKNPIKIIDIICCGKFNIICEFLMQRMADMHNKKILYLNSK